MTEEELQRIRAEAWDDGWNAGYEFLEDGLQGQSRRDNPYRNWRNQ